MSDTASDPATPQRRSTTRPVVVGVLGIVALTTLFFALFVTSLSAMQEQRSQHQLYAQFRGLVAPASPVAPSIGGVIAPGTPVAMLTVPLLHLRHVMVGEGTTSGELLNGPGHLRDSPLPGQGGDSVIIGPSVSADAPFGSLSKLRRGDSLTVVTGEGTFHYRVLDTRYDGDAAPKFPDSGSALTLVSAAGTGWWGSIDPSRVIYVDTTLVGGEVAGTPRGRPVAVARIEIPGQGDVSAWPWVTMWLFALLLVGVAMVWLWNRWRLWRTWLIGGPIAVFVLWSLSDQIVRLLPNVY